MTPQERDLLAGLFDRIRTASAGPRDPEAEAFIAEAVRAAPAAPYLLSQTVIVQEEALKAAAARIEELQAKTQELEKAAGASTSFLGGIGKSMFGGGDSAPRGSVPSVSPRTDAAASDSRWTQQGSRWGGGGAAPQPQGFGQPQGAPQAGAQPQAGGSFLKGAMGAAAGVAGGMLLANSISGLLGGHNNPLGISSAKAGESKSETQADKPAGESGWGAARDEQTHAASHDDSDEDDSDDDDDAGGDDAGGFWDPGDSGSQDV
ncbi:MAG: putative periplasmic ligand-binding sensor protein [Hyphomicrobiales bacterium]|nr:putative periplasmic ligand-binding sensor protein [Hyphomicrobiales bacterium]